MFKLQEALKSHGYWLERASDWLLDDDESGYIILLAFSSATIQHCQKLNQVRQFLQSLESDANV